MTTFWSWYVTILSLGTIFALTWLIFGTRKGQREETTEETVGHSFDGIEEFDNPLPKWWFMLFVGTIIFALGYLALYPGLGNWKGLLPGYDYLDTEAKKPFATNIEIAGGAERNAGWTGVHQWEKEMAKAESQYGPIFAKYAAMPIEQVAQDEQALKMGGRQAAMPAWKDSIGEEGIRNVAGYIRTLSGLKNPEGIEVDLAAGQNIFATNCAVCHGAEGKGQQAMGAPNLTDKIWLYGSSFAQVQQTLRYGRNGKMPAQADFLGNDKVHLLAAYVYSLSQAKIEK